MDVPYEAYQALPTGPARVGPGATTYSTSTTPDGRIIYHLFKYDLISSCYSSS